MWAKPCMAPSSYTYHSEMRECQRIEIIIMFISAFVAGRRDGSRSSRENKKGEIFSLRTIAFKQMGLYALCLHSVTQMGYNIVDYSIYTARHVFQNSRQNNQDWRIDAELKELQLSYSTIKNSQMTCLKLNTISHASRLRWIECDDICTLTTNGNYFHRSYLSPFAQIIHADNMDIDKRKERERREMEKRPKSCCRIEFG